MSFKCRAFPARHVLSRTLEALRTHIYAIYSVGSQPQWHRLRGIALLNTRDIHKCLSQWSLGLGQRKKSRVRPDAAARRRLELRSHQLLVHPGWNRRTHPVSWTTSRVIALRALAL